MSDLSTYAADVRQLSREGFMRRYPHPFLLIKADEPVPAAAVPMPAPVAAGSEADDDFADSANHTRITTILPKTGSFAVLRHNAGSYRVYALAGKDPMVAPELNSEGEPIQIPPPINVSVGRLPENDIVLTNAPISKRHAVFSFAWGPKQVGATLIDKGSRNGTFVKGRRLTPDKPVAVDFGDAIVLGDVAMSLIGAGALWEIIRQQDNPT
jgi:hypothetical protein